MEQVTCDLLVIKHFNTGCCKNPQAVGVTAAAPPVMSDTARSSAQDAGSPETAPIPKLPKRECWDRDCYCLLMEHESNSVRQFETGATRDTDEGKLDYEGFISPLVWKRFAEHMHKHRIQSDGRLRASDNWQKGIPLDQYMKSLMRHFMDMWLAHRMAITELDPSMLEETICAIIFNAQGYLHEMLKTYKPKKVVRETAPDGFFRGGLT